MAARVTLEPQQFYVRNLPAAFECSRSGIANARFGGLFFFRGFAIDGGLLNRRRRNARNSALVEAPFHCRRGGG
jgi:hypothetical protein